MYIYVWTIFFSDDFILAIQFDDMKIFCKNYLHDFFSFLLAVHEQIICKTVFIIEIIINK